MCTREWLEMKLIILSTKVTTDAKKQASIPLLFAPLDQSSLTSTYHVKLSFSHLLTPPLIGLFVCLFYPNQKKHPQLLPLPSSSIRKQQLQTTTVLLFLLWSSNGRVFNAYSGEGSAKRKKLWTLWELNPRPFTSTHWKYAKRKSYP